MSDAGGASTKRRSPDADADGDKNVGNNNNENRTVGGHDKLGSDGGKYLKSPKQVEALEEAYKSAFLLFFSCIQSEREEER